MGNCLQYDHDKSTTQQINEELKRWQQEHASIAYFIVIGTKGSGKTTFCKQMQLMDAARNVDEKTFISIYQDSLVLIREHCLHTMQELCIHINDMDTIGSLQTLSTQNDLELMEIRNILTNIWKKHKSKFLDILNSPTVCFPDNMDYFLDKIEDIMHEGYMLCSEDILRHHTVDNSINEIQIDYLDNHIWRFIDIGSHPLNVNKLYLFDNVVTVIYIISLSDYCKNITTKDGNLMNAMQHSLEEFKRIRQSKYLNVCHWSLILNKEELFKQKFKEGISLSVCFGDEWKGDDFVSDTKIQVIVSYVVRNNFDGEIPVDVIDLIGTYSTLRYTIDGEECDEDAYFEHCYEDAIQFILEKFQNSFKEDGIDYSDDNKKRRLMYPHGDCEVINTKQMERVTWGLCLLSIANRHRRMSELINDTAN